MSTPDMTPDIAVVVISYKQEQYLPEALDSVLAQTAAARIAEIVVVDDRSPDGSHAVARAYEARDPRIRAIQLDENSGGAAGPRNAGMAATTAPWIAFLDGDDIWLPEKLATMAEVLDAKPGLGMLFSDYMVFDSDSEAESRTTAIHYDAEEPDQLARFFVKGGPAIPSATIISRAAYERVGGFDVSIRFNEEQDFWLRIIMQAPVQHIRAALIRKREWFGSLGSTKYALANLECKREITRLMLDRVPALEKVVAKRTADIELKTAVHHFSQGETALARRHLKVALELDPKNRKAQIYRLASYLPGNPDAHLTRLRTLRSTLLAKGAQ